MASWRKSSFSFSNGNCAEVAAWRKSTRSAAGNCAEVGSGQQVVGVRDSKLKHSPVLVFPAASWRAFAERIKADG